MADRSRDQWLRLQSVQVIAMLPEDPEEARRILAYAGRLLDEFIAGPPPQVEVTEAPADLVAEAKPRPVAIVLPLVRP
jgi:hypothetical protein